VTCVRDQLYSSAETSIASIGSLRILEEKILAEKEIFWYTYINSSSRKIPDTVPLDVNCTKIQRCDKRKICAIICAPGSVQVDTWLQETLKIQRKLAYQRTICHVQLPGTHNSAINMADVSPSSTDK
jgi:hypothetical protein